MPKACSDRWRLMATGTLIALIVFAGNPQRSRLCGAEHTPEEFLTACRPALEQLETKLRSFSARAHHRRSTYEADIVYYKRGPFFQSITTYVDDGAAAHKPRNVVRSASSEVAFEIGRTSDTGEYSIAGVGEQQAESNETYEARRSKPFVLAATHVFAVTVRELLDSKGIRIVSVISEGEGASLLEKEKCDVLIEFDDAESTYDRVAITFAPLRGWVVTDYKAYVGSRKVQAQNWTVYRGHTEYVGTADGGLVVPKRVEFEGRTFPRAVAVSDAFGDVEPIRRMTEHVDFQGFDIVEVPEEQFRLSHFGLPDSRFEGPPVADYSRLIYLVLANVVIAVALFAFIRFRHKLQTAEK